MTIQEGKTTTHDAPLRVVFCDEDSSHVKQYAHVVQQICKMRGIPVKIMYYPKGEQLLDDLQAHQDEPTVVISETQLCDGEGMEVLRKVREQDLNCEIILLSKDPKFALEGYEIGATAYLLKKATRIDVFTGAFDRALDASMESLQQYITFSCAGFSETIRLNDILYFEVVRKIVTVHYVGGSFDFYSTLGKIEDSLASYGFVRVHRNYVVSLAKITRHVNDEVILENGATIPIGRNYRKSILASLKAMDGLGG